MANWKPVPNEKCIYVRDYGNVKTYQLQAMYGGIRYTDTLGEMTLDDVRIIRDTLLRNRKLGIHPLSWVEMQAEKKEVETVKAIENEKKRKDVIKQEAKRQTNTFGAFWDLRFWPHREGLNISAKEKVSMLSRWEKHLKKHFQNIPLEDAEPSHFDNFVKWMRENSDLSETTIHKCVVDLRVMWTYAKECGIVEKEFLGKRVAKAVLSGIDNEKKCWLTPEEAQLLIKTVYERRLRSRPDHDVYCFVVLGLGLGLRAGDIYKINAQTIERHIIDKTKNKRSRFVHFNFGPVQAMLQERLELYPPEDALAPLFVSCEGKYKGRQRMEVPSGYFRTIKELGFNEVPRRMGHPLEKIDFHALRHTFATFAAMRGVDHLTLMRLMGHKTPMMTLRYIEIADAHQAKYQELTMQGIFPVELDAKAVEE